MDTYPTWKYLLDEAFSWFMWLLQAGAPEVPQRTHPWNHRRTELSQFDQKYFLTFDGDSTAKPALRLGFIPTIHAPIFGGWTQFVVLEPSQHQFGPWYVGWCTSQRLGETSCIPLFGPVRMLIGPPPGPTFFAVDETGVQIGLQHVGFGRIGAAGVYSNIPLL